MSPASGNVLITRGGSQRRLIVVEHKMSFHVKPRILEISMWVIPRSNYVYLISFNITVASLSIISKIETI